MCSIQISFLLTFILLFASMTKETSVFEFPSGTEVIVANLQGEKQLIDFDHVYAPDASQESVFEDMRGMILSCVDGA